MSVHPPRTGGAEAWVVLFILALLVTVQAGEAMAHEHQDRFSLYTGCGAMELLVDVDLENSSLSLSTETIRSAAEARLRAARLYQAYDGDHRTTALSRRSILLSRFRVLLSPSVSGFSSIGS